MVLASEVLAEADRGSLLEHGQRERLGVRALGDGTPIFRDGTSERRLTGHRGAISAAALSADGTRLASASVDGTVRVWDPQADQPIVVVAPANLGVPTALAFTGGSIVIGFSSGAVRLIPITAAGVLARACSTLRRFARSVDVAPYCD